MSLLGAALLLRPRTAKSLASETPGTCFEKYCGSEGVQVFVDRAVNTAARDDRPAFGDGLQAVRSHSKKTFVREAAEHPSVARLAPYMY